MTTLSPIRAEQAVTLKRAAIPSAQSSGETSEAQADGGIYGYCSWHGGWFDRQTGNPVVRDEEPVSHGICRDCSKRVLDEAREISKSVQSGQRETSDGCSVRG